MRMEHDKDGVFRTYFRETLGCHGEARGSEVISMIAEKVIVTQPRRFLSLGMAASWLRCEPIPGCVI